MLPFIFDFDTYCAGPNDYWTLNVKYNTHPLADSQVPRKQIITINAQHVVLDLPNVEPCSTVIHFGPDVRELTIKALTSTSSQYDLEVNVPEMLRHLIIKGATVNFEYHFDKDIVHNCPAGTTVLHVDSLFTSVIIQPRTVCVLTLEHCTLDLIRYEIVKHLHDGMRRFVCVRMLEVDACSECQPGIQSFLNERTTPDSVIKSKICNRH